MTSETKILLVEVEDHYRTALAASLSAVGFKVTAAPDGKAALTFLQVQTFDLIISEIRTPRASGLELLKWVKSNSRAKVILITSSGFKDSAQRLLELGADGFFSKPFAVPDLLSFMKFELGIQGAKTGEKLIDPNLDGKFCKLSIKEFAAQRSIPFGVYARLSQLNYVKLSEKAQDLTQERIFNYQSRGVRFLYLKREDFKKFVEINLKITQAVRNSSQISMEKKRTLIKHASEVVIENVFSQRGPKGVDPEAYTNAQTFLEASLDVLADDPGVFRLLELLNTHSDALYAHCLGVSMYSVMIARKIEWVSAPTAFKLSVGGLLHDIGKKEIDRDILNKPREKLSLAEEKLLETHPIRGMELLSQIPSITDDILQIVLQHHENCLGIGTPSRLDRHHIHPLAKIVGLANVFCNYAIAGAQGPGLSASEAIQRIETLHRGWFELQSIRALKDIFARKLSEGTQKL